MLGGIWAWAQTIWSWTLGGLPSWFVLPGLLLRWSRPLRIDNWPAKAADFPKGAVLDLLLGPDLLLKKHLTLPIAARQNLPKVIDLKMRQSLPGGGADLIWRYGTGKRHKSNLEIPVYLLKRSTLAEIKSACAQNARVRTIGIAEDATTMPFWDNRKRIDRPRRFWQGVAVALAVALLAMVAWQEGTTTRALQSQVTALKRQKSALAEQAVALRAKLDEENASFAAISRDLQVFLAEYHRLHILLDLAKIMDDETWISELSIIGSDLHLSGFTGRDVTDVMANLRNVRWVQRVDLNGPVSFDSFSRRNRFDLSVDLRPLAEDRP